MAPPTPGRDAGAGRAWHAAARLGLLSCGLFGPKPTAVVMPLTAPPLDRPLWQPAAPARRRAVAAAAHVAPVPLGASSASSGRRLQDGPRAEGSDGLPAWEKIVTGAPPTGPFSGWKGALEGQGRQRIGAARAVHYVIDPANPRTGKLGRRLRRRLGLSVWKDFAMDLFRSKDLQHWSKGTWKKLEQEEKHLARELGCIEVLMGPILEAAPDAGAEAPAGGVRRRGKLLGGFKVYCVPSVMALAGGFIDRLGEWWPLRDSTLRVWEQLEESGVELAEMESTPLTMQTLFSETPGLEDYDPISSAAFAERVSKIVVVSPCVARRAGKKQTEREAKLAKEVLRQMRSDAFTPEVVEKVYREVDRRLPRSGRHGLLPNLHTRNVYNMVADVIFAQAKADIEPYILRNASVPREMVQKYVRLRDVNKGMAINRTSAQRRAKIASRNLEKYNDARGPGTSLDRLIATKGALGAVLGSFATRGRDLLLWGNKAGDKIDTWRWLSVSDSPVKSPWRVKDSQVRAFKDRELRRLFGGGASDPK